MWRNDRDRPDDPGTRERETQRLARDEYDRPRYGTTPSEQGYGPREDWHSPTHDRGGPPAHEAGQWRQDSPSGTHQQFRSDAVARNAGERGSGEGRDIHDMPVHELMTRRVSSVHPATSVERAARLMEECDCGALPVIGDNGVLVGMITDRDIAIRIVARGRDARYAIVADCMSERVFACYANESVAECMRQMALHRVRRMPIVDDHQRLVGIIAQGDLARHAGYHPGPQEREALTEVVSAVSQPGYEPYR